MRAPRLWRQASGRRPLCAETETRAPGGRTVEGRERVMALIRRFGRAVPRVSGSAPSVARMGAARPSQRPALIWPRFGSYARGATRAGGRAAHRPAVCSKRLHSQNHTDLHTVYPTYPSSDSPEPPVPWVRSRLVLAFDYRYGGSDSLGRTGCAQYIVLPANRCRWCAIMKVATRGCSVVGRRSGSVWPPSGSGLARS